jgi:hypothetical protein
VRTPKREFTAKLKIMRNFPIVFRHASAIKKCVLMAFVIGAAMLTAPSRLCASEPAHSGSAANEPRSSLPLCVNSARDLEEIRSVLHINNKTPRKYDGYRKSLYGLPSAELAARLAYAETLAANCPEQNDRIGDLVAAVIGNRIRIRRGDVESVVFQRDQFASSLNMYAESRYRDFLCPEDNELWNSISAKIRVNLSGSKPSSPMPADTVNYYLYQHSASFKAPDWRLEEVPIADTTRHCIRVFRNPAWK